jgi:hypothetical protein
VCFILAHITIAICVAETKLVKKVALSTDVSLANISYMVYTWLCTVSILGRVTIYPDALRVFTQSAQASCT